MCESYAAQSRGTQQSLHGMLPMSSLCVLNVVPQSRLIKDLPYAHAEPKSKHLNLLYQLILLYVSVTGLKVIFSFSHGSKGVHS